MTCIAVDARLHGTGGGISRYIEAMIAGIGRAAANDGISVITYGLQSRAPVSEIPHRRLEGNVASYYGLSLPAALRRDGVDAFFAASALQPVSGAVRTVGLVYDIYALRYPEFLEQSDLYTLKALWYWTRAKVQLAMLKSARHIVAISESTRRDIARFAPHLESRTKVVYPGTDDRFAPNTATRQRFILYVGGFNKQKNLGAIVRAHRRLNELTRDPVRLILAGYHGWPTIGLDKFIMDEGRPDLVEVLIRPTDETIISLYQTAAVATYVSLYEGFGLPILEAIRCGTPVVVHDASSLPEIAPFPECRVDSTDIEAYSAALLRIIDGPASDLVARLQRHATRFSYELASRQVYELLRSDA